MFNLLSQSKRFASLTIIMIAVAMSAAFALWQLTVVTNAQPAASLVGKKAAAAAPTTLNATPGTASVAPLRQRKLVAGDGANNDQFGSATAISGNTLVVSARYDDESSSNQGSVYVYLKSGATWTQQAKLTASDPGANEYFGNSVAIEGDTIVIGAEYASGQKGAAYIFVRSNGVWTQQAKVVASDGAFADQFGRSVSVSGNTVIVTASSDDVSQENQGSAYIFVRNGTAWTQQAKITSNDGGLYDYFGVSALINGDTAFVGAIFRGNLDVFEPEGFTGAVYVFTRSNGVWTQTAKLRASDPSFSLFGNSVALSGNTLAIGANFARIGNNSSQGAVYIFVNSNGVWTQQAKIAASDGASQDYFGSSVSISGDTLLVGSPSSDPGSVDRAGSAYIFKRSNGIWTQSARLIASDGTSLDALGGSVTMNGNNLVVGAANDGNGSVYSFQPSSVTTSDFDGDGRSDVSVFRPSNGTWYLNRSTGGFSATQFGLSSDKITPADYDGDGVTDIAVWRESSGTWYVLQSSNNAFVSQQWGASGDVPVVADYDADGRADFGVWRPSNGLWFVLQSGSNNSLLVRQWGASTDKPVIGDYDGDGRADFAVWRPSNGTWFVVRSSDNAVTAQQWGLSDDRLVPADYDADGRTDYAVWRASSGTWYILRSSEGYVGRQWGLSTDVIVPGDYDGDGRADYAVWRGSNGSWYLEQSTAGFGYFQFGLAGDAPTPAGLLY